MKRLHRNYLNKGVDILKRLHFRPENIMVTGSVALDLLGLLPEDRFAHDIDFIIKMDDQTWRCLKLIEAIYSDENIKEYPDRYNTVFLKADGLTLNIWKQDNDWSEIKDSVTGVRIATADQIIQEKKKYGRPKDYKDINDIIKNLL